MLWHSSCSSCEESAEWTAVTLQVGKLMRRIYRTALVLLCLTAMASAAPAENPFYLTGKLTNTTTDDNFGDAITQIIDGDDEGYSVGLGLKLGRFLKGTP